MPQGCKSLKREVALSGKPRSFSASSKEGKQQPSSLSSCMLSGILLWEPRLLPRPLRHPLERGASSSKAPSQTSLLRRQTCFETQGCFNKYFFYTFRCSLCCTRCDIVKLYARACGSTSHIFKWEQSMCESMSLRDDLSFLFVCVCRGSQAEWRTPDHVICAQRSFLTCCFFLTKRSFEDQPEKSSWLLDSNINSVDVSYRKTGITA